MMTSITQPVQFGNTLLYWAVGVRQSFASAIIRALPLPPRHKDTKYTKWGKRESLLVGLIQCSNLDTGVFYFCHGWSRIFTEKSESIDENLWKSVQSVAENAVSYGQNDFRQTPVPTSKYSTWLFFVPSWRI